MAPSWALPNALYTYVPDRAGLERALVESVIFQADLARLDGPARTWRSRIPTTRWPSGPRCSPPGVAPLLMTAPMDGPAALAVGER